MVFQLCEKASMRAGNTFAKYIFPCASKTSCDCAMGQHNLTSQWTDLVAQHPICCVGRAAMPEPKSVKVFLLIQYLMPVYQEVKILFSSSRWMETALFTKVLCFTPILHMS